MKLTVNTTTAYRRSLRRVAKRGCDMKLLETVVDMLANGQKLPEQYRNHKLTGNYVGSMECHLAPDWLLIYRIYQDKLILLLTETGTHEELF